MSKLDHPFAAVVEQANKAIAAGATTYQKYTCENCGSRQTIDVPNTFYTTGSCEECHHITDLTLRGCNYLAIFSRSQPTPDEIRKEQERNAVEVKERQS